MSCSAATVNETIERVHKTAPQALNGPRGLILRWKLGSPDNSLSGCGCEY